MPVINPARASSLLLPAVTRYAAAFASMKGISPFHNANSGGAARQGKK